MKHQVRFQVLLRRESSVAVFAHVRPRLRMRHHVLEKIIKSLIELPEMQRRNLLNSIRKRGNNKCVANVKK